MFYKHLALFTQVYVLSKFFNQILCFVDHQLFVMTWKYLKSWNASLRLDQYKVKNYKSDLSYEQGVHTLSTL